MESLGKADFDKLISLTSDAIRNRRAPDDEGYLALLIDLFILYESHFGKPHTLDRELPELRQLIDSEEKAIGQRLTEANLTPK